MAWLRPIGAPATRARRTILGPQPNKLLGTSDSLPRPPPAVNHWAPRAKPSPTPGRIPLPFSILPRLSLLPRDLTRSPRAEAEAEKKWEKGKGQLADLLRGAVTMPSRRWSSHRSRLPAGPQSAPQHSPLSISAWMCGEVREAGNRSPASWAALTSGYLRRSLPPPARGAAGAPPWPLRSGHRLRLRPRLHPVQLVRAMRASLPHSPKHKSQPQGWLCAASVQPGQQETARSRRGGAGRPGKGRTSRGLLRSARADRRPSRTLAWAIQAATTAPELLSPPPLAPQAPSLYPYCPHPPTAGRDSLLVALGLPRCALQPGAENNNMIILHGLDAV